MTKFYERVAGYLKYCDLTTRLGNVTDRAGIFGRDYFGILEVNAPIAKVLSELEHLLGPYEEIQGNRVRYMKLCPKKTSDGIQMDVLNLVVVATEAPRIGKVMPLLFRNSESNLVVNI